MVIVGCILGYLKNLLRGPSPRVPGAGLHNFPPFENRSLCCQHVVLRTISQATVIGKHA